MCALKRNTRSRKTGSHIAIIKAELCVKGVAERAVQVPVERSSVRTAESVSTQEGGSG